MSYSASLFIIRLILPTKLDKRIHENLCGAASLGKMQGSALAEKDHGVFSRGQHGGVFQHLGASSCPNEMSRVLLVCFAFVLETKKQQRGGAIPSNSCWSIH